MWCISFPSHYLSSSTLQNPVCRSKTKTMMKKFNLLECCVLVQLFISIFHSFHVIQSIVVSAKHIRERTFENNVQVLSLIDGDKNEVHFENLKTLSPAKLVGDESNEHNQNDNSIDDIHKLLIMDDAIKRDATSTPVIGNKFGKT